MVQDLLGAYAESLDIVHCHLVPKQMQQSILQHAAMSIG